MDLVNSYSGNKNEKEMKKMKKDEVSLNGGQVTSHLGTSPTTQFFLRKNVCI